MAVDIIELFNTETVIEWGKFKKNVTVQFFYPHALNME